MPRKRFTVEETINHLREADVWLAQGRTVGEVCRQIGISEQSYYRWRRKLAQVVHLDAKATGGPVGQLAQYVGRVRLCSGSVALDRGLIQHKDAGGHPC